MQKELAKKYEPQSFEDRIYKFWTDNGYFHATVDENKKPYTIVIPPPNITGQLHMGHALDETLQDILIRWRRMQGYEALWMPGTDHASIATEAKIVEAMRKEGITKEQIGREAFLERAWDWKEKFGGRIVSQLKKLGSSCDWDRERFTLDEGCSKAVKEVFLRLYEKGLIYRGNRMVNWCPHCNTSISDAEVEHEEKNGNFWHLLYEVKETGEKLELATTRPETMLGDTAVAINEADERYKHLHGCHVILPILNKEIPIVCDEHADMEKGTGVVKITPAHDPNDFEVGKRHNLQMIRVLTYDGYMTGKKDKDAYEELKASGNIAADEPEVLDCKEYAGMDILTARKAIVAKLSELGVLKEVEPLTHDVGTCYRCHSVIEPMVSKQWFVKMEPLAKPAVKAVEDGEIKIIPQRFEKTYYNWMTNIKDWCISRQLWWGHRIPAWYCADCGEVIVARKAPDKCPKCKSTKLSQDEDTLDTWFSSALWPFSTLGWPDKTPELDYFYPTNTLVTGYDIIFFWVARMIFSGLEYTGKAPFDTVLFHGIVRDAEGRKMSKSLGNGIDPLIEIEKYGADALRFTLATGNSPGNDMRYSSDRVEASRNFANKLWNAARFVMMNLNDDEPAPHIPENLATEDKWLLSKYNTLVNEVTDNLEKFELGLAVQKLYDFIWDVYCDWYIEICKPRLNSESEETAIARAVLVYVLSGTLKLLHPFMPFITEEIWQALPHDGESIMVSSWPLSDEALSFEADEQNFEKIMALIKAIRARRAEMNVPPSKKAQVFVAAEDEEIFKSGSKYIEKLAFASSVTVGKEFSIEGAVTVVTDSAVASIPLNELVDFEAELARLNKELATANADKEFFEKKLNNKGFIANAPAAVVEKQRESLKKVLDKIDKLNESINSLK